MAVEILFILEEILSSSWRSKCADRDQKFQYR